MATETDRPPENGGEPKGEMGEDGTHEFFVVNVTTGPLDGKVYWEGGGGQAAIEVKGLQPGQASPLKGFDPQSGKVDWWKWSERGGWHQLNIYGGDRYVAVTLSNYGIGVLPTATSPDTWKW
ncbi:hypothetical protein ACE1SV_22650 [Streptomyces sp. E-15]|uniref:hypothetical protein n=1 Tax=Streptomyces sp. NPDC018347 TaxID=3157193 RepID=UPI003404DBF5